MRIGLQDLKFVALPVPEIIAISFERGLRFANLQSRERRRKGSGMVPG